MTDADLRAWQQARNECAESDVYRVDAEHAARCGFPALAALSRFCGRVEQMHGPVGKAELLAELRPLLSVAVGEAQARAEIAVGRNATVPGVPTIPRILCERDAANRSDVLIAEAIALLDKSRGSFRSQDVAQARELLERLQTEG